MDISRRDFLKIAGATAAGAAILGLGLDVKPFVSHAHSLKIRHARETISICCYCAVGCGLICHTDPSKSNAIINIEGDPDHPINEGSLCAKGAALSQMVNNPNRILTPLHRPAFGKSWTPLSWEKALSMIAQRIKKTRDATFTAQNELGQTVNRTPGIASTGSAALDNEECWVYQAMLRALGLVWIEHQARI